MNKLLFPLYVIFLLSVLIFSYFFVDPNLLPFKAFYSGLFYKREITTVLFIFLLVIFYFFYFKFMNMVKRKEISLKKIVVATSLILFFSYPAMLSYDIFNYIATSKVVYHYKENPYIVMPIEFTGDPLLAFTRAANKTVLYGPVWILLSAIPYYLSFDSFIPILFSFKLLTMVFYFLTLFLIKKMTNDDYKVAFFALNPLIIIETLIGSHNDIVMMFLALLSVSLLFSQKIIKSYTVLLLSILVKLATIVLLPIFVLYNMKSLFKKETVFYYSCLVSMAIIFFLSSLREEIYPWYFIWVLAFAVFLIKNRLVYFLSIIFSFSLLLRYVPYILTGDYFGHTPIVKIILTFLPSIIFLLIYKINFLKKVNKI